MSNEELADELMKIADLLEEQEENPYRIRAYRRAASSLRHYPVQVKDMICSEVDLTSIPKIGVRLAEVLKQLIAEGKLDPPSPSSPREYPDRLQKKPRKPPTFRIYTLMHTMERILRRLQTLPGIRLLQWAGDYRRKKEIVGDTEILMLANNPKQIFEEFHKFAAIKYLVETKESHTIVQLRSGIRLTLLAVTPDNFGAKLLYATGSPAHYEEVQRLAQVQNLRLTDKGLFKQRKKLSLSTEEKIYGALGLSFIPPE